MTFLRRFAFLVILFLCVALIYAQSAPTVADAHFTFTTIDVPGAVNTSILGINSLGRMVGYYEETTNGPGTGFLLSSGNFTFFNYPGSDSTDAFGINDSGLISGTAIVAQRADAVGFLYDGTNFTTIRVPGNATFVHGIN